MQGEFVLAAIFDEENYFWRTAVTPFTDVDQPQLHSRTKMSLGTVLQADFFERQGYSTIVQRGSAACFNSRMAIGLGYQRYTGTSTGYGQVERQLQEPGDSVR